MCMNLSIRLLPGIFPHYASHLIQVNVSISENYRGFPWKGKAPYAFDLCGNINWSLPLSIYRTLWLQLRIYLQCHILGKKTFVSPP